MAPPIGPNTELIYKFIVQYQKGHGGVPPTYKQIGEFAGISHKGPVAHHLNKLREQGLVESDDSGRTYATGGVWLDPNQISQMRKVISSLKGHYEGVLPKDFWDIMGWITDGKYPDWVNKEPVVRGEDLEPVEENYFKPTQYRRTQPE